MKFGPEFCDVVIRNRGTLEEFFVKVAAFARFAGRLKQGNKGGA